MRFGMLTTNPIIDCALLAWFLAQLAKVILEAVLLRKLDLRLFVSSGGMPSMARASSGVMGSIPLDLMMSATSAMRTALLSTWTPGAMQSESSKPMRTVEAPMSRAVFTISQSSRWAWV